MAKKSKNRNSKRSPKKKLNLESSKQQTLQHPKRPSTHVGGRGSKHRRRELRTAQFGNSVSEVEAASGNGELQHKESRDDDLSPQTSDSETTPYEKLIGLLRPDIRDISDAESDRHPEEEEHSEKDISESSGGEEVEEEGDDDDDDEKEEEDAHDGDKEAQEEGGHVGDHDDRDGPEALQELGLYATAQSSDEEGSQHHESDTEEIKEKELDSFHRNFHAMSLSEDEAKALEEARNTTKWRRREAPGLGCSLLWRPGKTDTFPSAASADTVLDKLNLDPKIRELWEKSDRSHDRDKPQGPKQPAKKRNRESSTAGHDGSAKSLTDLQRNLLPLLNEYLDLHYSMRTPQDAEQLREAVVLHVLNHVTQSRKAVVKNNAQLKKKKAAGGDVDARDQGFTRCKVLILLPARNSAYRLIRKILALCPSAHPPGGRVDGEDRFEEEFGPGTKAERAADRERLLAVGEDHYERFEGNVDDHFRVGIQLHGKYARLFAPFYAADIIVASPLGLRMIVKSAGDKGREYDFLSSVEMLVVDQLDYLLMQNLDHLFTVMDAVNKPPQQPRGVDFSRLREPFLDDLQRYLRQTVVFAAHAAPEGNALVARHSFNVRGVVKTEEVHKGTIRRVLDSIHARQTFHRLPPCGSLAEADQARFDFFSEHLYRRLSQTSQSHTLVVVPSYMQFVRVRNLLNREEANWQECTEYSTVTQVSHGRSSLFHGRCDLLVMTERFYFYHRFRLRGVHHIIFYGLPHFPDLYPELVNLVSLGGEQERGVSVTAIYSSLDRLALHRIVGTPRAERMLASDKTVHLFA